MARRVADADQLHASPVWEAVLREMVEGEATHGPMNSEHEAQSVLAEEFHEFTLAVWFGVDQHGRQADPRREAIQVAAVALRFWLQF